MIDPKFSYSDVVKEFLISLRYLGGVLLICLGGPRLLGQGKGRVQDPTKMKMNLGGPLNRTQ